MSSYCVLLLGASQLASEAFDEYSLALTDEVPAKSIPSKNLLADLQQRYYAEQDCLIGQLRSHDARGLTQHDKWLHMVLMRIETRRAEKEEWFDEGAISIGLFERGMEVIENRYM